MQTIQMECIFNQQTPKAKVAPGIVLKLAGTHTPQNRINFYLGQRFIILLPPCRLCWCWLGVEGGRRGIFVPIAVVRAEGCVVRATFVVEQRGYRRGWNPTRHKLAPEFVQPGPKEQKGYKIQEGTAIIAHQVCCFGAVKTRRYAAPLCADTRCNIYLAASASVSNADDHNRSAITEARGHTRAMKFDASTCSPHMFAFPPTTSSGRPPAVRSIMSVTGSYLRMR